MQRQNVENISPALHETPKTQMSSKEFQRMLYTWFEEKGLVADLRSYLRVLMINELKNTTVGKIDSGRTNFSLSKQAFGLLIAEHLLREGCHYTLSIFSTEVPGVANQVPFSLFEARSESEKWRFDEESVLNVLELIGVSKGSGESVRIAALYFTSEDSLLTCLVNGKVLPVKLSLEDGGDYLRNVLTVLGVPPNMVTNIRSKIEEEYLRQVPVERRQLEELQTLLSERNNQMKILVEEQISVKKENTKLKTDLKETQKRLKRAVLQEQSLNLRESEIREKLSEVTRLQRSLERSLQKEKVEVCLQKHCTESCQNLVGINDEMRASVSRLEESNKQKDLEIERLKSKIESLTKDLHSSKLNIEFLNTCLLRSNQINLQHEEPVVSSEDSSENLTGEILKQVRTKLNQLERESDDLDVKFKKLKLSNFVTK